eukprot:7122243-Alexandrium_andersonii.AAC.1
MAAYCTASAARRPVASTAAPSALGRRPACRGRPAACRRPADARCATIGACAVGWPLRDWPLPGPRWAAA